MTGLLDRLKKQEMLTRQRCTVDRRIVHVQLTHKANPLLEGMDESIRETHRQLMGHLTGVELKELSRLLEKARASLPVESPPG